MERQETFLHQSTKLLLKRCRFGDSELFCTQRLVRYPLMYVLAEFVVKFPTKIPSYCSSVGEEV